MKQSKPIYEILNSIASDEATTIEINLKNSRNRSVYLIHGTLNILYDELIATLFFVLFCHPIIQRIIMYMRTPRHLQTRQ